MLLVKEAGQRLNAPTPNLTMSRLNPQSSINQTEPPLVFVVDDNPALAEMTEMLLQSAGYQTERFSDPAQALQAMREAERKPVLLVTDYDMGTMTGLELVESSQRFHPDLKTILLSGTVGAAVILAHPVKVNKFLGKPYQSSELTRLAAELLNP